jgi:hypothetical protein
MLFFDLFTFCQQWLYLPLNLELLFSKAVAVIVLLYLAVWPLNSLYFGQLARRQAYLVELSFRGAHLVFQLTFRFILWIFIVQMVRRKRGFQDQEKKQTLTTPRKKRGSRRLRLIVATSHSVDPQNHPAHPHPLFFTPPQACTRFNLTPAELEFYCNVDHLLTDPTNPQILWHLRRI